LGQIVGKPGNPLIQSIRNPALEILVAHVLSPLIQGLQIDKRRNNVHRFRITTDLGTTDPGIGAGDLWKFVYNGLNPFAIFDGGFKTGSRRQCRSNLERAFPERGHEFAPEIGKQQKTAGKSNDGNAHHNLRGFDDSIHYRLV
jgi:hypothetical protein